ncbi:MAG: hypothetical protein QF893_13065 [Alphaproteobacteria bacterium]|jgi:hypothetical protein|nr:hypothetical protein [Alphaproteobacteria bacterium]
MSRLALLLAILPAIALAESAGRDVLRDSRHTIESGARTPAASGTIVVAASEDAEQLTGVLDATAHGALAKDARINIRQPDGSPLSTDISRQFAAELESRGYLIDSGAGSHRLRFRLSMDDIDPDPDMRLGVEEDSLVLRMRMSERPSRRRVLRQRVILVELTTPDGDLLWSARASTSRPPEDPHDLAALLVPALADHLGETVYGKKVQ